MSLHPLPDTNAFWCRLKALMAEVIREQLAASLHPMAVEAKTLLKVKEVCALFAISRPTLYQWMQRGKLPSIKLGARRYFKREHIQALLEQSEEVSSSQRA